MTQRKVSIDIKKEKRKEKKNKVPMNENAWMTPWFMDGV